MPRMAAAPRRLGRRSGVRPAAWFPSIAPAGLPAAAVVWAAVVWAPVVWAPMVWTAVGLGAVLAAGPAQAQGRPLETEFSPGFGVVIGQGQTENGAIARRFGFTSRRLQDGDRMGSMALLYEEHRDGLDYDLLDESVRKKDVSLHFQTLYLELKRYFPTGGPLLLYWGLRGGYTRVEGRVNRGPGEKDDTFQADSVAPLWWLALPFVLEHPGFILLAGVDGSSVGITFDIVPEHVWLDLSLGTVVLPEHRDHVIALQDRFTATGMLQLVVVF